MQHVDVNSPDSIKAVLLDFGGVLAEEGFHNGLQAMAREQGLNVGTIVPVATEAVYDSGFVLGQGTAADFWKLMRERSGLQGEDEVLTNRILEGFIVRPWMKELVQQLREQGFVTGILSDQTDWLDELDDKYHFYEVFDHVFNSYYLGKGKHDQSIFSDIAEKLGLAPASILFVDDDAGNVLRAADMGFQTIRYIDQQSFLAELTRICQFRHDF